MSQPMMQQGRVQEILDTRGSTHGDFRDNGWIMQALKVVMRREGRNWNRLQPYQQEALDMIQHKIGRILCGDPDYLDHWDDIVGYAMLVTSSMRARPSVIDRAVRNSPPPLDDVGGSETAAMMDPEDPDLGVLALAEGGSFMSQPRGTMGHE